jgi:hypothetical protein
VDRNRPSGRILVAAFAFAVLASRLLPGGSTNASGEVAAPVTFEPLAPATAPPMALPEPECDPTAALFAVMFRRLSALALANASIPRATFDAQLDANRELVRSYLEGLGLSAENSQIEDLLQGLPAPEESLPDSC